MDTKLVDKIYVDRSLYENDINAFFDICFTQSIQPLLKKQRWIEMDKHFIYDAQVNGCWLGLDGGVSFQ